MKNNEKRKQSSKKQDTNKTNQEKCENQSNNNKNKKRKSYTSDQSQSWQTNVRNEKSINSKKKKTENADYANKEDRSNFLPGQRYKTPDEDSGALAFYKSLYEQNPKSQMAKLYCLQNGVLEYNEALRVIQELSKVKVKK